MAREPLFFVPTLILTLIAIGFFAALSGCSPFPIYYGEGTV